MCSAQTKKMTFTVVSSIAEYRNAMPSHRGYSWVLHAFIRFSFSIKSCPAETESRSAQDKQGRNAVVCNGPKCSSKSTEAGLWPLTPETNSKN